MKRNSKPPPFYKAAKRDRGVERYRFPLLLSSSERSKLVQLTKKMKMNASEVIRHLIEAA